MLLKEDLPEMEESAGKTSRTARLEGVLQNHPCRPLKFGAGAGKSTIEGLASKANTLPLLSVHAVSIYWISSVLFVGRLLMFGT